MKNIDLTQLGGFPLTQDTLDYIQDISKDILKMYFSNLMLNDTGKYIVGGAARNGTSTTKGWLVIDGELFQLNAGNGNYVKISQIQKIVTFEDTNAKAVYTERFAEMTNTASGNILFSDFERLQQTRVVTHSDCTYLAGITYKYDLPKFVTKLELSSIGNTTGGFVLNRIEPFEGIPDGYELVIKCGVASGFTFLKKAGVGNNISFKRNFKALEPTPDSPYFGLNGFIASGNVISALAGYASNLHLVLKWSASDGRWLEIARNSHTLNDWSL